MGGIYLASFVLFLSNTFCARFSFVLFPPMQHYHSVAFVLRCGCLEPHAPGWSKIGLSTATISTPLHSCHIIPSRPTTTFMDNYDDVDSTLGK
mmetsp:Transcript_967/g.2789  ORF Transcript_967/g.2789 Transcript_967/m.2789 type:complete len:93 (+) Transcript_967:95-373(+)